MLSTLLNRSWIVFRKDLRLEFRTKYGLNAIFMFAVTTLVAVSFAIGPASLSPVIAASLLWIIIFFSAMSALAHIFVREEEQSTADLLRLSAPPTAVWMGKWLFNVLLLLALLVILVPLYLIMLNVTIENFVLFTLIVVLGCIALSSVSTIVAVIVANVGSRGALFAILTLPVILPVLMSTIHGTRQAMIGTTIAEAGGVLVVLISFIVIVITASVMVFESVWRN